MEFVKGARRKRYKSE